MTGCSSASRGYARCHRYLDEVRLRPGGLRREWLRPLLRTMWGVGLAAGPLSQRKRVPLATAALHERSPRAWPILGPDFAPLALHPGLDVVLLAVGGLARRLAGWSPCRGLVCVLRLLPGPRGQVALARRSPGFVSGDGAWALWARALGEIVEQLGFRHGALLLLFDRTLTRPVAPWAWPAKPDW